MMTALSQGVYAVWVLYGVYDCEVWVTTRCLWCIGCYRVPMMCGLPEGVCDDRVFTRCLWCQHMGYQCLCDKRFVAGCQQWPY